MAGQASKPAEPNYGIPASVESERAVLAAILFEPELADRLNGLKPEHFFDPRHIAIFEAIGELCEAGSPPDYPNLLRELERRSALALAGGNEYLLDLLDGRSAPERLASYVKIIAEKAEHRRLANLGRWLYTEGSDAKRPPEDIIRRGVEELLDRPHEQGEARWLIESRKYPEKLQITQPWDWDKGLPTGYIELDKMIGGLRKAELVLIGARPSIGKSALALNIVSSIAKRQQVPILFFSLEMGRVSLIQRMIAAEANVSLQRWRRYEYDKKTEGRRLSAAFGIVTGWPIAIDDHSAYDIADLPGAVRRFASQQPPGLIVVDYLQYLSAKKHQRSQMEETTAISRRLKQLARDHDCPVLALSQLSRESERRRSKDGGRPILSDLRSSGCLAGDTRIEMQGGHWIPIQQLAAIEGRETFVASIADWKVQSAMASKVWRTGEREVYLLTTASGRQIRATGNHPFRVYRGYRRLDQLRSGDVVAVLRRQLPGESVIGWDHEDEKLLLLAHMIGDGCSAPRQPLHYTAPTMEKIEAVRAAAQTAFGIHGKVVEQPEKGCFHLYLSANANKWHPNPMKQWLRELGLEVRSPEKFVPPEVFSVRDDKIAHFLRHLWATDGHVGLRKNKNGKVSLGAVVYYTTSRKLAEGVQHLLMRIGILSRIGRCAQGKYRDRFDVHVSGAGPQLRFAELVGAAFQEQRAALASLVPMLEAVKQNTNVDTLPIEFWEDVHERRKALGITCRGLMAMQGKTGSGIVRFRPSRSVAKRYASLVRSESLLAIADSDIYWDRIVSIEPCGVEPVYDMTVTGTHNFVANGFVVHNSLEQDSDIVLLLHRRRDNANNGVLESATELIVAKQRNGPTGTVNLHFHKDFIRFDSVAKVEEPQGHWTED